MLSFCGIPLSFVSQVWIIKLFHCRLDQNYGNYVLVVVMTAIALTTNSSVAQDNEPVQTDTTTVACLVQSPSGTADSDAHTAALPVCQALRGRDNDFGEPVYDVSDSANVYRVGVHLLGAAVQLRASHEIPVGTVIR